MLEVDSPLKREAQEATEFARRAAKIIKTNVQPIIPEAIEGPHAIGDVEVYLIYVSEFESEISISYNREQITFYNISPNGIKKTGMIEQSDKEGKLVKYYEDDPVQIRKLKDIGREVATPPLVVPAEKALIAQLIKYPTSRKICSDLRQYAMWMS